MIFTSQTKTDDQRLIPSSMAWYPSRFPQYIPWDPHDKPPCFIIARLVKARSTFVQPSFKLYFGSSPALLHNELFPRSLEADLLSWAKTTPQPAEVLLSAKCRGWIRWTPQNKLTKSTILSVSGRSVNHLSFQRLLEWLFNHPPWRPRSQNPLESFRDAAVDHAKHGDDTSVVVVKTVED